MNTLPKILCVDDEPNVLSGLKRQLRQHFDVVTADNGLDGIKCIEDDGPFSVVLSDMRMPKMDGAEFLLNVKRISPLTTRLLLTGYADLDAAQRAVNESEIFRFLTKPCSEDALMKAVNTAAEHSRLLQVEKELLEETLQGSIKALIDVLGLTKPEIFSKSSRIKQYAIQIADALSLNNRWQIEMAAMLCQIGCVAIPDNVLEKASNGIALDDSEESLFDEHPNTGYKLIKNIPRLENVATIIKGQDADWHSDDLLANTSDNYCTIGSQILKVSIALDTMLTHCEDFQSSIERLKEVPSLSSKIIQICASLEPIRSEWLVKSVNASALRIGMILDQDVLDTNGSKLVGRGHEVSEILLIRIQQYVHDDKLTGLIKVKLKT